MGRVIRPASEPFTRSVQGGRPGGRKREARRRLRYPAIALRKRQPASPIRTVP